MEIRVHSATPASEKIVKWAEENKLERCFDRAEKMKQCPIGETGACCKVCHMGPCRLVGKNAEEDARGVCGATLPTVAARKMLRMIAAGTSAHSDHARGMVETLLAVADGEAKDFQIKDVRKLYRVAGYLNIEFEGRPVNDVAREVALKFLEDFGRQRGGEINYTSRAPKKTQERWRKWGIGEVVDSGNRDRADALRGAARHGQADGDRR